MRIEAHWSCQKPNLSFKTKVGEELFFLFPVTGSTLFCLPYHKLFIPLVKKKKKKNEKNERKKEEE